MPVALDLNNMLKSSRILLDFSFVASAGSITGRTRDLFHASTSYRFALGYPVTPPSYAAKKAVLLPPTAMRQFKNASLGSADCRIPLKYRGKQQRSAFR